MIELSTRLKNDHIYLFSLCRTYVCVWRHTCATSFVPVSWRLHNFQESDLTFHHVRPGVKLRSLGLATDLLACIDISGALETHIIGTERFLWLSSLLWIYLIKITISNFKFKEKKRTFCCGNSLSPIKAVHRPRESIKMSGF